MTIRTFVTRKTGWRTVFEARVSVKGKVVFRSHYSTRSSAELACECVAAQYGGTKIK